MRRIALISVISLIVMFLLTVTAWSIKNNPCISNVDGKIVCPPEGGSCIRNRAGESACSPPYGGILMTIYGKILCGPGNCAVNLNGKAFCSAVPDGSIGFDRVGEPICTGGCVPASESDCIWP